MVIHAPFKMSVLNRVWLTCLKTEDVYIYRQYVAKQQENSVYVIVGPLSWTSITQLTVMSKLPKGALSLTIQVVDKDVKDY